MSQSNYSRRSFIRALGIGAAASLPVMKMLERDATADGKYPLRFLGIFTPHGKIPEYWDPQGSETNFNLVFPNSSLAPLDKHKAKLLFVKGLSFKAASEKGYAGHDAVASAFTGTKAGPSGASVPAGPSIDQVLADYLAQQPGGITKVPSLQLGVLADGTNSGQTISYRAGGQRMPNIIDPKQAYDLLFAGLSPSGGPDPAQQRLISRRKSVIDFLTGDLMRLKGRLGMSEQAKLDAHISALRDIELRLGVGAGAACSPPSAPAKVDPRDAASSPVLAQLHADIIAQAFACDLTRVATFMIHFAGCFAHMPYIGLDVNPHDGLVHYVGAQSDATTLPWRIKASTIHNWYAQQVAYLLDKLDAIPEGSGTVLDHTIIYWTNELGNPAMHDGYDVPTIVGGAAGIFRTGRFVTYGGGAAPGCTGPYGMMQCPGMVPHNQLLVSIQNAFGIASNTFGDADYPGALPNLT